MSKILRTFLVGALLTLGALATGCDNNNDALLLAQQPDPVTWSSPGSVTAYDPMAAYQGVTVFHDDVQRRVFVVQMDGTVVGVWKAWSEEFPLLNFAKPLDGGMMMLHPGFSVPGGSAVFPAREVAIMDFNGNPLWEWFGAPNLYIIHHEFFLLENGNAMVLVSPKPDAHFPDISPEVVQDDVILEIDPTTDEIVWSWSTAAHYSQLPFTAMQRTLMLDQTRIDVFHTNAFHVIPDNDIDHGMYPEFTPGNILVSQRQTNFVFIIDRATGDVVWNLDHDTIGNIGQHMIRMIPKGLPGAGNLLLFDNGCCAGLPVATRESSRVLEIEPVSQAVVWSYDIGTGFYSEFRSGAQRLPNGNTLISASQDQRIFEVTSAGDVVWDYQQTAANGHYRAYRVDTGWLSGGDTGPVTPFPW